MFSETKGSISSSSSKEILVSVVSDTSSTCSMSSKLTEIALTPSVPKIKELHNKVAKNLFVALGEHFLNMFIKSFLLFC